MKEKTTIKIKEDEVAINWKSKFFKKGITWSGHLEELQIIYLKKFAKTLDFKYLGDFLNCLNKTNKFDCVVIIQLMWAFSKRKSIKVIIDDSYKYTNKKSQKGIKQFNKLLKKVRKKSTAKIRNKNEN